MNEEHDIFGDGVNVAARLEGLAETGGICVSRVVRDQVRYRLGISFEDLGEKQVKNIARPVRAYRALDLGASAAKGISSGKLSPDQGRRSGSDRPRSAETNDLAARIRRFAHDRLEAYGRLRIGIGFAPGLGDAERFERPKEVGVFLGRHHVDEATKAQPGLPPGFCSA
jgi:hypothetical protein